MSDMMDPRSDEERDRERRGRRSDRPMMKRSPTRMTGGERDRSPRGKRKGARVFVSNIPYEYRWQELKDLFREQVGEVSFVELFVDENDRPRGCGVIEFANPELAQKALEKMHRYDLKGRKLVIKEDSDVERDKYGRIVPRHERAAAGPRSTRDERTGWSDIPSLVNGPRSESGGTSSKWGNTYGLSTQFLESLNINGPLVPRVFVANLDYKVDEKKMREVFRLAGRVLSTEISVDKEGKSRGFGVVEYEHPVEAVQAISMFNNQILFDRRLSVRMDRIAEKGDGHPPKLPEGLKGIGMGLGANGVPLQDVARNLPNPQNSPQTAAVAVPSVNTPALTAAALTQLGAVSSLMGAGSAASELTGLGNTFGVNASSLGGSNSLAAQFLNSSGGGLGLGGSSAGRDFDSLSAALTAGGAFSQGSGMDRGRQMGGGGSNSVRATDTVILKNLPPGTTWQMLRDKCRDAGEVKFAEMRGKDAGIVQFTNQWDAQRAINMLDGVRVDGRTIDVHYF